MSYTYKGYNPANCKHVNKYISTHYKRVSVCFDSSYYMEALKPVCDGLGLPVSTFIKQAVEHEVEHITKK